MGCQVAVIVIPVCSLLIEDNTTYMDMSNSEKHDTEKEKIDEDSKEEITLTYLFDENIEMLNHSLNFGSSILLSLHALEAITPPPEGLL